MLNAHRLVSVFNIEFSYMEVKFTFEKNGKYIEYCKKTV